MKISKSSVFVNSLAILALLFAPGCAYLFHGTSDEIHIQSGDPNAKLYLNDEAVGIASATATVDRDRTYTIRATAPGCEARTVQTGDKFDSISLLGLFVDVGIVSILVIDMGVSGAAWKTYPLTYTVNPICPEIAQTPQSPQAQARSAASSDTPSPIAPVAASKAIVPANPNLNDQWRSSGHDE